MKLAICIICYNRPDSLKRVLSSVQQGYFGQDKVDLIISIDYSGSGEVEQVAKSFEWHHGEKKIIAYTENLGLRQHVLKCGDLTSGYDGLIVLEDDIYVAPSFYLYAKTCVEKFSEDNHIAGISLYSFAINYHNMLPFTPLHSDSDVYLMQNAQSWGQVWMPKQWAMFKEWYSKNSDNFPEMPHLPRSICRWERSWLKYHTRYCIEQNKYFIYPYVSLSTCFSDAGEHTNLQSTLIQVPLLNGDKKQYCLNPTVKYDAFFENEDLHHVLGISDPEDLCIDIYGEKQNREKRRYLLTRNREDYKVIRTFGILFKPQDANILNSTPGSDIFLYDTTVATLFSALYRGNDYINYLYNFQFGIKRLSQMLMKAILRKLHA